MSGPLMLRISRVEKLGARRWPNGVDESGRADGCEPAMVSAGPDPTKRPVGDGMSQGWEGGHDGGGWGQSKPSSVLASLADLGASGSPSSALA
jgi:hypothetical protein